MIGLIGLALHGQIQDQETIMPMLATELFPAWLAGIAISGAIAAMMSTADSQLLVTTSAVSEDIVHKIMGIRTTQKKLVMISRIAALGVGIIAFILALEAEDLVYDLVLYAWAGLGASFGPGILLTLWWKKTTRQGVFAGMIAGMLTVLVWYHVPVLRNSLYEMIPGFVLALLSVVGVSLATQEKSHRKQA